jgi:signal transduction histidine kinase
VLATGTAGSPVGQRSGELVSALQRVSEQLRSAIYDLGLGSQHGPFPELLEELVEVHRSMMEGGEIELEIGEEIPTGSLGDAGREVLRIVGEALTNARRHADARRVRVRLWGATAAIWAEVSDDGRGFDPTTSSSPLHHGISGMQQRAEMLGGHLTIHREPDAGTTVRLDAILTSIG